MGIQVQPNCCGKKSIYYEVYKLSGFPRAEVDWTYLGASAGSVNLGYDVDLKNGHLYASWKFGEIWRINSDDATHAIRIAERPPKTALTRLTEFRVFPDLRTLLFSERVTGFTPSAILNSLNLDTNVVTSLDSMSSFGAGNSNVYSPSVNLQTRKVVFLKDDYVGPKYDVLLKECDLSGGGMTTLATIETNITVAEPSPFTFADVDYQNNKYWFVEHEASGAVGARRVMRCNWDGSGLETVFDSSDILPWFTTSPFTGGLQYVSFADGQIFDNKIHFRGSVFNTSSAYEYVWFEANLDGSGLRAILRKSDFPASMWGVFSGELERTIWGDGFDDRRGRLP